MMNQQRLDEIRKRCVAFAAHSEDGFHHEDCSICDEADAMLAHAPTDIPELLAEVERLRACSSSFENCSGPFPAYRPSDPEVQSLLLPPGSTLPGVERDADKPKVDIEIRFGSRVGQLGNFGPHLYLDGRELPRSDYVFDERTGVVMIDPEVMQRAMDAKIAWSRTPPSEPGAYWLRTRPGGRPWIGVLGMTGSWFMIKPPAGAGEYCSSGEYWPIPIAPPEAT